MKKMTKILAIVLALASVFALGACSFEEDTQIKVGVLKGPTGMGAVKIAKDSEATKDTPTGYSFTFYETANVQQLNSDILNGTVDIAALPINAAAALFNKSQGKIQVIATNALGVLSIVGTEELSAITELKGKTIHTTGQASTPEYIIRYLLEKNGMNAVTDPDAALGENDVRVLFYADGQTAMGKMKLTGGYAMLPEPAASAALKNVNGCKIIFNVTEEWDKVCDTKLVQGCLVVNKEFADKYPNAIEGFLKAYSNSVSYTNGSENASAVADLLVEYGILAAPQKALAGDAIPRANIVCITGKDMKKDVSAMLTVLHTANAASVGGKLPTDDFYGIYDIK
jgi:NitT/TauT family transport system substrate-binding protein